MKLNLTPKQAKVVEAALDLYSRIGMGQLEDVAHVLGRNFEHVNRWDLIQEHIRKLKQAAFPDSAAHIGTGSWGITNKKVPESFRVAYEIQQVIRGDEHPLKITPEPLPTVEK